VSRRAEESQQQLHEAAACSRRSGAAGCCLLGVRPWQRQRDSLWQENLWQENLLAQPARGAAGAAVKQPAAVRWLLRLAMAQSKCLAVVAACTLLGGMALLTFAAILASWESANLSWFFDEPFFEPFGRLSYAVDLYAVAGEPDPLATCDDYDSPVESVTQLGPKVCVPLQFDEVRAAVPLPLRPLVSPPLLPTVGCKPLLRAAPLCIIGYVHVLLLLLLLLLMCVCRVKVNSPAR
jgi:hypothetical protein